MLKSLFEELPPIKELSPPPIPKMKSETYRHNGKTLQRSVPRVKKNEV